MEIKPIESYIPHRKPFLYVDEILALDENKIATSFIPDEALDFFKGHYPNQPIMPGVLINECVFQSAAILISANIEYGKDESMIENGVPALTRIKNAKFKGVVKPNDKLFIEATIEERLKNTWFMKGKVKSNEKMVLTIDYSVSLIESF